MCDHKEFISTTGVTRLTDNAGVVTGYAADISIKCKQCDRQFEFVGLGIECGVSSFYPTTSIDRTELRIPIKPHVDELFAKSDIRDN